jgi:UDP-N-acetylenolpyruvoylglucosamine reductase
MTASDPQEIFAAFEFASDRKLRVFVYSGGSNLFFDDAGFRGLVVRLKGGSWELAKRELPPYFGHYEGRDSISLNQPTDDLYGTDRMSPAPPVERPEIGDTATPYAAGELASVVKVGGGYELTRLVRELARLDLGGIEFLANIPGSVAGAVAGNAGCYGRAVAEVLVEAEIYSTLDHETRTVGPDFFEFRYRHSRIKHNPQEIVVSATFRLLPRSRTAILGEVEAELAERLQKHPHDAACAGSFFQNPSRERPAWKLLTDAGMAEATVGGAQFSPKHANFLVNTGGATSRDIIALARQAQEAVLESSGMEIIPEVRYVGPEGVVETLPDF